MATKEKNVWILLVFILSGELIGFGGYHMAKVLD